MTEFPLIYLITDGELTAENFTEKISETLKLIETAVQNNISLIQIREKNLPTRLVFEIACKAAKITRGSSTKLLINDRADIALAAKADGVHLTSRSLSCEIIRSNFPKSFIVGVSAHSFEETESAKNQKANFATFSPIFPTPRKNNLQSIADLTNLCAKLRPFPIIALGGIDAGNFSEVLNAGASGFAAIRFLNSQENLKNLSQIIKSKSIY